MPEESSAVEICRTRVLGLVVVIDNVDDDVKFETSNEKHSVELLIHMEDVPQGE